MNEANPKSREILEQEAQEAKSRENEGRCSIFPDCPHPKSLEKCTPSYEITQCPFREREGDYLSRQQETR